MILDTTFLIDVMRKDPAAIMKAQQLTGVGEPQLVTVISLFELSSGLARSKKPAQEQHKITTALANQIIIQLDEKSAMKAGEIDGLLCKQGTSIGPADALIAGIALSRDDAVLTKNVKDFSRVPGLRVVTY